MCLYTPVQRQSIHHHIQWRMNRSSWTWLLTSSRCTCAYSCRYCWCNSRRVPTNPKSRLKRVDEFMMQNSSEVHVLSKSIRKLCAGVPMVMVPAHSKSFSSSVRASFWRFSRVSNSSNSSKWVALSNRGILVELTRKCDMLNTGLISAP